MAEGASPVVKSPKGLGKSSAGAFSLSIDQQALKAMAKAIRAEGDGKALRRDLVGELKDAVAPGVTAVQGKLRSMPHRSATTSSPALGTYVAQRVKAQVRTGGRSVGVFVRIPMTPSLRGFKMAGRRLNAKSWRHQVYGKGAWVTQVSPIPEYFDKTLAAGKAKYRKAVVDAMEKMARRIASRVK